MTAPHKWFSALGAALIATGCSSPAPAPLPKASSPAPGKPASAFCLDLTTFQVGVVVFRGDTVDAVRGKPLDFKDLKLRAATILRIGKEMKASAPPDIAPQFRAVLKAVSTSASELKSGSKVRDVVGPLFNKRIGPSFDAVDKYKCR